MYTDRKRIIGIFVAALTIALVWLLDHPAGSFPALGRLLDPVNGALANGEVAVARQKKLRVPGLHAGVGIGFEERMVPHIQANDDHDLYFTQGYLHACFRLWQMDMQTRAAAGRISEVAGKNALQFDRGQRRKGMVYAAERSLRAMEREPRTRDMLQAYTEGVNTYISSLNYRDYPLEYKLMGFRPEPWSKLKSALLLKYMADDLTGQSDDFAMSLLRKQLSPEALEQLFPEKNPHSSTVIPQGTRFGDASLPVPQKPGPEVFVHLDTPAINGNAALCPEEPGAGIGSNNWVISGSKTLSGAPLLCNDPHLAMNLPSLWYEVQLQGPGINVYGVSLPGAPGVIIGFNDSISWGLTNNYRDVKDYYQLTETDQAHYLFEGRALPFEQRIETIRIKDSATYADTVRYSLHGPVQYDRHFPSPVNDQYSYAMSWMAHRATNEFLSIYLLNRAGNYERFTEAISHFECPAQNFIYADRDNNIAIRAQGQFINKWKGQGRFVMEGKDSLSLWGADIPVAENPFVLNPDQGYLASANQTVTDSTYPYWYNGSFSEFRSWAINDQLSRWTGSSKTGHKHPISVADMMALQNSTYSVLAAKALPLMLEALSQPDAQANALKAWDRRLDPGSRDASLFQLWWYFYYKHTWSGSFGSGYLVPPSSEITLQRLLQDSSQDTRITLQQSYLQARDSLSRSSAGTSDWYALKNTSLNHLARIPAFSYKQLPTGGWGNTINAMKQNHGPSWRMIVEMGPDRIRAWGVYPGGQSGNPGSPYYHTFIGNWVKGDYYELVFLPYGKQNSQAVPYSWQLGN